MALWKPRCISKRRLEERIPNNHKIWSYILWEKLYDWWLGVVSVKKKKEMSIVYKWFLKEIFLKQHQVNFHEPIISLPWVYQSKISRLPNVGYLPLYTVVIRTLSVCKSYPTLHHPINGFSYQPFFSPVK